MESNEEKLANIAINSIEKVTGVYPGYRRAHARGTYYQAVFTPNGKAVPYTVAAHLQTSPVSALVRFSDSSPIPHTADLLSPVKGMSVQFQLPDQTVTDLVSVNVPVFLTKTPEAFVEILRLAAQKPGVRDLIKMFIKYPEAKAFFRIVRKMRPFVSYTTSRYYPIHAFYFVNENGRKQPVKYVWEPEAAFSFQAKKEAVSHPINYLEEELEQRLPVLYTLFIILGEETDSTNDSTAIWPKERKKIPIGQLEIKEKMSLPKNQIMFDPTKVPIGVECSSDPVLHFRPKVYSESFRRRFHSL